MTRLPDIESRPMSGAEQAAFDAIRAGPRGVVQGPLRIWVHSPELAERAQSLGAFCRYGSSLAPDLSELAIITIGAHWRAGFEWCVHAPIAEQAGVPKKAIAALAEGCEPHFTSREQAIVHAFTSALMTTRSVPSELFERAKTLLGERGVVDLVGVIGYYSFIAMTIVAFDVPSPEGATDPFKSVAAQR